MINARVSEINNNEYINKKDQASISNEKKNIKKYGKK